MKEIFCQIYHNTLHPYTIQDIGKMSEFLDNQIVKVRVYGIDKARSVDQLRLFWVCCNIVAANTEDQHWNNKDKVAFQVKVALHFVNPDKTIVDPKGNVHFNYRSISFRELKHMEACNFFDRAFEIMAAKIGVSVDDLFVMSNKKGNEARKEAQNAG